MSPAARPDTSRLPVVVLADMLCAAADAHAYPLRRPTADRLASATVELLELSGWTLTHDAYAADGTMRP